MTARKRSAKPKAEAVTEESASLTCTFCTKVFKYEAFFLKHMCTKKQRFIDRDEKHVKLAFWIYQRFYEIACKGRKQQTYDQFAASQFYLAFTRFGKYIHEINAVSPQAFVDFLIRTQVPVDRWTSPPVYEVYLRELNKKESADAALERNFLLMQQWSVETGREWTDFFREVPPALAVLWIRSGRISPWVLYTAPSAAELFARLSDEQMTLIQQALDPDFWGVKLSASAEEVEAIRTILQDAGI